jgi:hypothetical protein
MHALGVAAARRRSRDGFRFGAQASGMPGSHEELCHCIRCARCSIILDEGTVQARYGPDTKQMSSQLLWLIGTAVGIAALFAFLHWQSTDPDPWGDNEADGNGWEGGGLRSHSKHDDRAHHHGDDGSASGGGGDD